MSYRLSLLITGATVAAACQVDPPTGANAAVAPLPPVQATAILADSAGQPRGFARLIENASGGVHVEIQLRGMAPGLHGVHFHAVGRCDVPSFSTSGGHLNPVAYQHGLDNPAGSHAGDLPNLEVTPAGTGTLALLDARVSLMTGTAALLDADGAAVVVHAGRDDQMTDPSGASGARVLCGVLTRRQP